LEDLQVLAAPIRAVADEAEFILVKAQILSYVGRQPALELPAAVRHARPSQDDPFVTERGYRIPSLPGLHLELPDDPERVRYLHPFSRTTEDRKVRRLPRRSPTGSSFRSK